MGIQLGQESRILVADDLELARLQAATVLKELGFRNIQFGENGRSALEILEGAHQAGRPIELVLCDWNMPLMDGLELLTRLQQFGHFRLLPFIMVTAEMNTQSIVKAITAGASDYIVKPFTKESFGRKLRDLNARLLKRAG